MVSDLAKASQKARKKVTHIMTEILFFFFDTWVDSFEMHLLSTCLYHSCGLINNANLHWFYLPLSCMCFPLVSHPSFLESLPK